MQAIGYVRQSARRDLDLALSPEQQRADILKLAERDGIAAEDVTIFEDLGRSGGAGKERLRAGYQRLVAAVEAGGVQVINSRTLSRLARSVSELHRLLRLAQAHGTRIVTTAEGALDPTTATGRLQYGVFALFAEFERSVTVERAIENAATRRARGDRLGRAPYGEKPGEDPATVALAFEATRSLTAAARRLNGDGIPAPLGGLWHGRTVRKVLERHAPSLLPRRASRGVKPSSPFLLFRLLRCHCGQTLTASRDTKASGSVLVNYRCHRAAIVPDHPRPTRVAESVLLPWIKSESARLRAPEQVAVAGQDAGEREALGAERDRLGLAFARGILSEEAVTTRQAEIDAALEKLADVEAVIDVPDIDWERWAPGDINRVLSALWSHVELGPDMRPVRAEWRLPAEYVAP